MISFLGFTPMCLSNRAPPALGEITLLREKLCVAHPCAQTHCSQQPRCGSHPNIHRDGWRTRCHLYTQWNIIQLWKDGHLVTYYSMAGACRRYMRWNKPDTEGQTLCDFTSMRSQEGHVYRDRKWTLAARGWGRGGVSVNWVIVLKMTFWRLVTQ